MSWVGYDETYPVLAEQIALSREHVEAVLQYSSVDDFTKIGKNERYYKPKALSTEGEKVRLAYCSSRDNFSEASRLQNLLWRFDKEISKRAWGDEVPHAPSIHREHGWYLPNDD